MLCNCIGEHSTEHELRGRISSVLGMAGISLALQEKLVSVSLARCTSHFLAGRLEYIPVK